MGKHIAPAPARPARSLSRMTVVAVMVTSISAGAGASVTMSEGSPAAFAQAAPIVSTVAPAEPAEAQVPAGLAADPSARQVATLREVRENAPAFDAMCEAPANGFLAAFAADAEILISPMAAGSYRISSPYGHRSDPFTGHASYHYGTDFAAPAGTPIYAAADGIVRHAGEGIEGRSDNVIIIEHEINGEKFWTWYVHMFDDGILVSEGDEVTAGQHIAAVGNNGHSTGPHLHFEVHTGEWDNHVDPLTFLATHNAADIADLCN